MKEINELYYYDNIIFDFDGVIVNSDKIRIDAFKFALSDFNKNLIDQLLLFHSKNGGISRYEKLNFFEKNLVKSKIDKRGILKKFNFYCLEKMKNKKILNIDISNFIKNNYKEKAFFIASGSDNDELNIICECLGINIFFKGIFGSPKIKNLIVADIITTFKIKEKQTCLIGDSINDYDAAKENNLKFIPFNYK